MKKEKRGLYALISVYSLFMTVILITVALLSVPRRGKTEDTEQATDDTTAPPAYLYVYRNMQFPTDTEAETETNTIWILREYEGRIAVYDENDNMLRTVDIYTKTLPTADRKMLREGITVYSEKELYRLLADYGE